MHPHDSKDYAEKKAALKNFILKNKNSKLVAIGETGLDFYYENSSKEEQLEAFKDQIRLATEHNLPLIIHCRDAFKDLFNCLKEVGIPQKTGVMHCFTGTTEEALASVELGFYISFSGILTFKTAAPMRETLKQVPLDRILFETDCPFLAPMPNRGKPNEPSFLPLTAKVAADTLQMPIEKLGSQVYKNTLKLFGL
jgi:TatD DNase family protein